MRLKHKVALITGAGSGIGRASAILFAREGAAIVVACRTAQKGQDTVDQITQNSGQAIFVKTDVSKAQDTERMIKATIETYGRIDIYLIMEKRGAEKLWTATCAVLNNTIRRKGK